MISLLLSLWLWQAPSCGKPVAAYRVQSVWLHPIASLPGLDDDGNVVSMPIYSLWEPVTVQTGPEMSAEVPCDPAPGEMCAAIVTSLDEWGMEDDGTRCE